MDNRFAPHAFALLRVMAGLMWAMHGTRKIFGWPGDGNPSTAMLPVIGGWIEIVGGLLIAAGFLCSWAAFVASGTMAVAYWLRHGTDAFWPIANRGELAVLYCFLFLWIAAHGAGQWSVDWTLRRRRTRTGT